MYLSTVHRIIGWTGGGNSCHSRAQKDEEKEKKKVKIIFYRCYIFPFLLFIFHFKI